MVGLERLRQGGLSLWRAAERPFDAAFGSAFNPLRHLGAIGLMAFWLLAASGIVLYIVLDTSVAGAYRSIRALADAPLGLGVLLRGLHRYSADLLVLAMSLHLLREWLHGHERGFRRFSWLTGVPLIGFVFAAAIGGFWLNWDQLGQFSAIATAEWLDALPLLAAPLARNFLAADAVSDRLFSLFIFVHLGVPLLLLFGLWFHVQRITRAAVWPPRRLALGLVVVLAALALAVPVTSHAPAALSRVPDALRLDWLLLFAHPLADATSNAVVWALVAAGAAALFALPFLPHGARPTVAVVDPANCNGCRRCFADCPYAAITMVPHPNQRIGRSLAVVDADLCAACGICAGACPSSTPFRSAAELVTGIDMPQLSVGALCRRLQRALAAQRDAGRLHPLVLFGCDHGARCSQVQDADTTPISLLCTGQLPPSFVEYALRDGAAGVLVAACREGGCEFRLGERWTVERLAGACTPQFRAQAPRQRVELVFAGAGDEPLVAAALARLRARVRPLMPLAGQGLHHA
jgi:quinol-cytochrome oxidoreductase complex cytochrome b subunit/coenzyme F420-reducing hydrogenase delta subunit/Pyruvate/2-oxoacid:ferredoxin oxidoreductase delta subunit